MRKNTYEKPKLTKHGKIKEVIMTGTDTSTTAPPPTEPPEN